MGTRERGEEPRGAGRGAGPGRLSPAERNNARVLNAVDDGNRNFVVEG